MVPWVFTAICISPLRKSTSLYFCTWNILFFFPWNLSCIFSFAVMWFGLFFLNEMRRKTIFSTHVWRERKRKTSRLLYRCISLVFSTRGTLFLRPYYLSVLSLSFELRPDNVNWNSCILQLWQAKRTLLKYINELIIRNLNPLVNFKIEAPINIRIRIWILITAARFELKKRRGVGFFFFTIMICCI